MWESLAGVLADEQMRRVLWSLIVILSAIAILAAYESAARFREAAEAEAAEAAPRPCTTTLVDRELPGLVARWSGPRAGARVLAY